MAFIATAAIVGGAVTAAGGIAKMGMSLSGRGKRIAEQKQAKAEMEAMKSEYRNLDTSNLNAGVRNEFTNMENAYEDVTVNQQQAQFQAKQGDQQRANIMQGMQGAAGGSGIAGLAQAMANQGQLQTQKISASIGAQESQIQRLKAGEASKLQTLEREGEKYADTQRRAGAVAARGLEYQKTGTLLGMSQQRLGAANQARAEAKAAQMSAIGDITSGATQAIGGMGKLKAGSVGGLGLEGGGFTDPGFAAKITGGITGPTIDALTGKPKFKDLSNLKIQ